MLSAISLRNPVFAWMLMFAALLLGGISFTRLGLSQMPDVDFPVVNVQLVLEGASPEVMDTDVVDVIEEVLMSVEGVRDIRSASRQGAAEITVELDLNRDVDAAIQEVQARIATVRKKLPEAMDPPTLTKFNPEDLPILWLAATTEHSRKDLMVFVRNELKDQFQVIPGVGEVFLGGYVERNARVWLDARKMAYYEVTADDVVSTLVNQNVEVPAGRIETSSQEMSVRSMGEAGSAAGFSRLFLDRRGGSPIFGSIRLGDISRVEDGLDDVRRISRFNGKTAVGLGIRKQRGANAVQVARAVKAKMLTLKLPPGYKLEVANDATRFVEEAIGELQMTLVLSALLTGFVCWLFLGTWTTTFNVLLAIPTSIVGTFLALDFLGYTLNTFTLLALSLAIGIIVDDAIMIQENIVRHQELGQDRRTASLTGSQEIQFAALAATLSIVAIFLPVAFMPGIIGKYFLQFGIAVSVSVVLSLLEALTLTPMRCSRFLPEIHKRGWMSAFVDQIFFRARERYASILEVALDHRWKVIGATVILLGATFAMMIPLKKEFVPSQDQSQILVRVQTEVGSSIENTDARVKVFEEILSKRPEILRTFVAVGGFGGGEVNTAVMFLTLKPPAERPVDGELGKKPTQAQVADMIRKSFRAADPAIRVVIQDLSFRGFSTGRGFPIEFSVRGPDWQKLVTFSDNIMKGMKDSGKYADIDTNYLKGMPEVRVIPNRNAASERGVSMGNIGNAVGTLVGGRRVGTFTEGSHSYDVRVRLDGNLRQRSRDILDIPLRNNFGEIVRVGEIVKLEESPALMAITRQGRERAITLYANPASTTSQDEAVKEALRISEKYLEPGYRAELSGTAKTSQESMSGLMFALLLGIAVSYMILGAQFNSFIHPITVLLALPLSFSGAVIALLLTGKSLNVYSFIGIILLMGLVKKNSILLVDFTNRMREEGLGVRDAILRASPVRLRPILMTSVASIAAAIPPALALGPGAETRIPMAIAVIGGLLLSTVLTLVVVPCAYSLFAPLERKK